MRDAISRHRECCQNEKQKIFRSRRTGSAAQSLTIAVAIGVCLIIAVWIISVREKANEEDAQNWAMQKFGLTSSTSNHLHEDYQDADQDLVADSPSDASQWLRPETLTFSYVVSQGPEGQPEAWQPLMDAIAAATGLPVEFQAAENIDAQMLAMKEGKLHVTGLNTGSVPRAVNACGFVPVCTLAGEGAEPGLRTVIIVPSNSTAQKVEDLKHTTITFTSPDSNSGFKAPLTLLAGEFGMNPDIDYEYSFASSHDDAILQIASKDAIAAAVASDLLDRAIQNGVITEDQFRIIYQSERFPPAALGHVHNLDPEIAGKVRDAMLQFEIVEGPLSELFAHMPKVEIVPVTYKDDWSLIRRIDNSLGVKHTVKSAGNET